MQTLCLLYFVTLSSALQCLDEDNNPVDWYVIYKAPKLDTPNSRNGTAYFFLSSKTLDKGWVLSSHTVLDNTSAFGNTLQPFYSRKDGLWIMYNDQPPVSNELSPPPLDYGHTKGVVGADKDGGFWLVHSVPHFPSSSDISFSYPATGIHFGQSFFCVSLPSSQLSTLGNSVLIYNQPYVFKSRIDERLKSAYGDLVDVIEGKTVKSPPWFKKSMLSTLGNVQLSVFAKSKEFGKELYEWVASDLKSAMCAETWRNEQSKLPSSCDIPFKVYNVNSISVQGVSFKYTHDHSKWGVSGSKERPWVCVGDINRDGSQKVRGGGTVCMSNSKLWSAYRGVIKAIEPCTNVSNTL